MASLVVPCPKCPAKLAAPDSAVGKQIRCPKCGALATVPALVAAEEVKVVEAKVAAPPPKSDVNVTCCIACNTMIATIGKAVDGVIRCPKCGLPNTVRTRPAAADDEGDEDRPRKKKVRAAAVDDDEDDEDDRPRKKRRPRYADEDDDYDHDRRRKPKRKSGGGALIAGLIVGGLLLLCVGIGVAVYAFGGKGGVFAKKAPVPPGWEEHKDPNGSFRAFMPPGARYTSFGGAVLPGDVGGGRFGIGSNGVGALPPIERVSHLSTAWNGNPALHAELQVVRFRDRVPSAVHTNLRGVSSVQVGDMEMRSVKWLGYNAVEMVQPGSVIRIVYTNRHMVTATISGPRGVRAGREEEAAFFDNVEITE